MSGYGGYKMRKSAGLLAAIILTVSVFTGCSSTSESAPSETSVDVSKIKQEIDAALTEGPGLTAMSIDFNPANHGRIIPNITEYNEDAWEKEKDTALYGFLTIDGDVVCRPLFDSVSYNEDSKSFIVRRTEDGVAKYGILSSDGAKFTGLIFDGISEVQGTNKSKAVYYGTSVSDDCLWITGVDKELNLLDSKKIIIDESELDLDAEKSQLSALYTNDASTILINRSEFYYKTMLVDNSTGKLLYSFNNMGSSFKIFGNVIVEQDVSGKGITAYDMRGKCLLRDKNAMSGKVSSDRYMAVINGKIHLYDCDWNEVNTLEVPEAVDVMTSFGRIAVVENNKTSVYDKDLKLINSLNYPVQGGTYLRDWYSFGEGDMYYDSISGTKEIINLSNGAKINKEDGFYYSYKYGYIVADNMSNGNDQVKKWRVYDKDLKEIAKGEGIIDLICDEDIGVIYLVNNTSDVMTVYSLPKYEKLFSIKFTCYNLTAVHGRFYGWNKEHFLLCSRIGDDLCAYNIDYKKNVEF